MTIQRNKPTLVVSDFKNNTDKDDEKDNNDEYEESSEDDPNSTENPTKLIAQLKARNDDLTTKIQNFEKKVEELKGKQYELDKKALDDAETIQTLNLKNQTFEETQKELQEKYDTLQAANQKLHDQREQWKKEIKNLKQTNQILALKQKVQSTSTSSIKLLDTEESDESNMMQKILGDNQNCQKENQNLKDEKARIAKKLQQLTKTNKVLSDSNHNLEKLSTELKNKLSTNKKKFDEDYIRLYAEYQKVQKDNQALIEQVEDQIGIITGMKEQIEQLENEKEINESDQDNTKKRSLRSFFNHQKTQQVLNFNSQEVSEKLKKQRTRSKNLGSSFKSSRFLSSGSLGDSSNQLVNDLVDYKDWTNQYTSRQDSLNNQSSLKIEDFDDEEDEDNENLNMGSMNFDSEQLINFNNEDNIEKEISKHQKQLTLKLRSSTSIKEELTNDLSEKSEPHSDEVAIKKLKKEIKELKSLNTNLERQLQEKQDLQSQNKSRGSQSDLTTLQDNNATMSPLQAKIEAQKKSYTMLQNKTKALQSELIQLKKQKPNNSRSVPTPKPSFFARFGKFIAALCGGSLLLNLWQYFAQANVLAATGA